MAYCKSCGAEIEPESRFCSECGTELDPSQDSKSHQAHPTENEQSETGPQRPSQGERPQRQPSDPPAKAQSPQTSETSQMGSEPTDQPSWNHLSEISLGKKLALAGGGATIAGAFLPWFSVEFLGTSISRSGIDTDGIFTLILAAIAVVVVGRSSLGNWSRKTWVGVTLIGVFVAFLSLGYINDPWMGVDENPTEEAEMLVDIGIGLYLTVIGGVMLLAGPLYDKYA